MTREVSSGTLSAPPRRAMIPALLLLALALLAAGALVLTGRLARARAQARIPAPEVT